MDIDKKRVRESIKSFMLKSIIEAGEVIPVCPNPHCKVDTVFLIRSHSPLFMCSFKDVKEANEILEEVRRIVDSPLIKY
jgi:hypothetical protein